jgi:CRP/FNR family transcriptional regulator, anaerobic regulatory protein
MDALTVIKKFEDFIRSAIPFDREAFNLALPEFNIAELEKGDFFIEKDKTCRHFAYIAEGIIRAFDIQNGNEITTCICSNNTFATSTLSFITQTPSNIYIQALTPVTLLTIGYDKLNALYIRSDFWLRLGKIIMEKEFISLQQELLNLSGKSPDEKYLTLLKENPLIIRNVPLKYIASYLRITPETLSRIRKRTSGSIS